MGVMEHAKKELELLEKYCSEDELEMQKEMHKDVLEVLEVLCKQGHSGFSAHYIINIIKDLWLYKPLLPLIGNDNEWNFDGAIEGNTTFQNKRCSTVFKERETGKAYWADGYVYCEPNGNFYFTCRESIRYIKFPCNMRELKTEYRKLLFPSKYVPIKWAHRLHLYRKVG